VEVGSTERCGVVTRFDRIDLGTPRQKQCCDIDGPGGGRALLPGLRVRQPGRVVLGAAVRPGRPAVDDVDDARELIKRVLVECDAEVTTAGSAEEGLSVLATCEPDVLVSDIGMPDVDGYEFLRRLRALGGAAGKIPAVALTAFARSEDRVRALRAGYQVHVSKPVEPSELIATIASVMGRSAEPNTLQKVT